MSARRVKKPRSHRSLARVAGIVVVLCTALVVTVIGSNVLQPAAGEPSKPLPPQSRFIEVPDMAGGTTHIRLDTDLYLPRSVPAPAVLLAHGFAQTKSDLAPEAKRLQAEGYVVLAYTARGFGGSGGRIGLDSLDGEVPDARALIDALARNPDVESRGGDPVVGVVGASYGGALALMLGATDPRVDTVVAGITWNDLAQALDPASAGRSDGSPPERLFKAGWSARLFGAGTAGSADPCSRFTAQLCALYRTLVSGGSMTDSDLALLQRSSPSSVLDGMTAPTLLLQGLQDSLFGLDQADANARQIREAGAPVRIRWFDGGHDAAGMTGTEQATDEWLNDTLKHRTRPERRFDYDVPAGVTSFAEHHATTRYGGLSGTTRPAILPLDGATQTVVNPPGGQPESVTSLPGISVDSDAGRAVTGLLGARNPPGQAARFVTPALRGSVVLAGSARVRIHVTPVSPVAGDVVLFAQLTALTRSARAALPGGVAPIRVDVPASGGTITVALPASTWRFAPGDRIELTVRTTDSGFRGSSTPASFRLAAGGTILVPQLSTAASGSSIGLPSRTELDRIGLLLAVAAVLLLGAVIGGRLRQRAARPSEEARSRPASPVRRDPAPPLEVRGVTKRFRSGVIAVDDITFTVERGQVVGLLGENGAGKTTAMRMMLGLVRPDAGRIEAFGARILPGAPVLRQIGCFVEGPGFLPHLSGRRNLRLFWAATGRPRRDAHLEEVLAIADLGSAIRRRVGGYSQGMRQRLAIAQAMLGLPDLLVLDEPTNGLDPPQIVALRSVLRGYAAGGRTVILSSHLLGEVERTCSHLVVMSHGRVVASGPVAEVARRTDELLLEVDDPITAIAALDALGVDSAEFTGADTVRVLPGAVPPGSVLAALVHAGVGVTEVRRQRHLEDAFIDLIKESEPDR